MDGEMKERIKKLRQTLNLKQREIAEKLGVKVSVVGAWEIGQNPVPSMRVYQLCNEYGVRREWLETGEGEMFEPEKRPKTPEETRLEHARGFLRECTDEFKKALTQALQEESAESTHEKE